MAKTKKEVAEKVTEEAVETKSSTEDGKLKVKAKPSMKKMEFSNEPTKVDMSKPPVEKQEEEQPKENKDDKVIEEVQEKVEEEEVEKKEEETEQPVLEEVTDEKTDEDVEDKVEEVEEAVEEAVAKSEKTGQELPENIQKVVDFMNETGGDLEDYVKLNQDYSKLDDMSLLREYYHQTKPHLNGEEISFLIEDSFSFDEEVDETLDVRRKKLAFKEQVASAKNHMDGLKSKYYAEIQSGVKLTPEQQKAIDFFDRYKTESEEVAKINKDQKTTFTDKTNEVFNNTFKGFEYNVGEKKFRFNVNDVKNVKDTQSDIQNFISKYLDKNNKLNDAAGYHKSLFTAMNSDAIANHFYQQGKADAIKENMAKAKNLDMTPRETGTVDTGGMKVKVLGDNANKLRFKIKN